MTRSAKATTAAVLLLAACFLSCVPATSAASRFKRAKFKVDWLIQQETAWRTSMHDNFEICGVTSQGSGTQRVGVGDVDRVTVFGFGNGTPLIKFTGRNAATDEIDLQREGSENATSNSTEPCASGGGGGAPPPPPDCGSRTLTRRFGFGYSQRNVLQLGTDDSRFFDDDPYQNCPVSSDWSNRLLECLDFADCQATKVDDVALREKLLTGARCRVIQVRSPAHGYPWRYEKHEQNVVPGPYGGTYTRDEATSMVFKATFRRMHARGGRTCRLGPTNSQPPPP